MKVFTSVNDVHEQIEIRIPHLIKIEKTKGIRISPLPYLKNSDFKGKTHETNQKAVLYKFRVGLN